MQRVRRKLKVYRLKWIVWGFYVLVIVGVAFYVVPTAHVQNRRITVKRAGNFPYAMVSVDDLRRLSSTIENYHLMVQIMKDIRFVQRPELVLECLRIIDKYLPEYFPNGEFSKDDIIALIVVESQFDPYAVSSKGAFGVMQILHYQQVLKRIPVTYNILEDNIQAGLCVLRDKYNVHRDYKMALIAYNGLVKSGQSY